MWAFYRYVIQAQVTFALQPPYTLSGQKVDKNISAAAEHTNVGKFSSWVQCDQIKIAKCL